MKKLTEGVADYLAAHADDVMNEEGMSDDAIFRMLDKCYRESRAAAIEHSKPQNLFIWGDPGTGKTDRVKEWAVGVPGYRRGIPQNFTHQPLNLVEREGKYFNDIKGIYGRDAEDPHTMERLGTNEWNELDVPNSVLYVDELNRGTTEGMNNLLLIADSKQVQQGTNTKKLKGLVFTIASMNYWDPEDEDNTTGTNPIPQALARRGRRIDVTLTPKQWLKYYAEAVNEKIEDLKDENSELHKNYVDQFEGDPNDRIEVWESRFEIGRTLVEGGLTEFDSTKTSARLNAMGKPSLNAATLTAALGLCDGTVKDFLDCFQMSCGDAQFDLVKKILAGYKDNPNLKANSVFGIKATAPKMDTAGSEISSETQNSKMSSAQKYQAARSGNYQRNSN